MTPRLSPSDRHRHHRPDLQALYDLPDLPISKARRPKRTNWYLRTAVLLTLVLLGFSIRTAWATDSQAEPTDRQAEGEERSRWGLGLGAGVMQKAYRDIDNETIAIPLIIYDNKWISVTGPTISVKLPSAGPLSFAVSASLSRDGYEASDSDALAGMDERKDNVWVGGSVTWANSVADMSARWMADVSGYSEGQKFSVSAERSFAHGKFEFTPRVGAVWLDENYVDYYYGVKINEVTADRGFYAPTSTVNLEAGLRTTYKLTTHKSFFVDLGVDSLGSEIKGSPIVDGSTDSRIFVGYVHMF